MLEFADETVIVATGAEADGVYIVECGAAAAERAASAREQAREHVGVYRREQDRRAREECEWLEVERAQEGEEEEDAAISMRDIFGSDSEEDDTEV